MVRIMVITAVMAVALSLGQAADPRVSDRGPELCFKLVDGTVITGRIDAGTVAVRIASGNVVKVPVAALRELTVGLNDRPGFVKRVETLIEALDSDKTRNKAVADLRALGPAVNSIVKRHAASDISARRTAVARILEYYRAWPIDNPEAPERTARPLKARSRIRTDANAFSGTLPARQLKIASRYGPVVVKVSELVSIAPTARTAVSKRKLWRVELRDNSHITARPISRSLHVRSRYGTMVVPMDQIEQATFANGAKSVRVQCWGSDRIDGAVDPKTFVSIKTDKGAVRLALGKIVMLGYGPITLRGHSDWVRSVAFSPDSKRLASGCGDKTIKIWDALAGGELLTLKGHSGEVSSVAFSPDGKLLASGSYDGSIKLWDTADGKELLTIKVKPSRIIPHPILPDGARLVPRRVGRTIRVDQPPRWKKPPAIQRDSAKVCSVAFSPDGESLASGGRDNTVRIWDTASGKRLLMLEGHSHWVSSVAFSSDGKRLASGSHDKTTRLWDSVTGKKLLTLKGHANGVWSVAFTSHGKALASFTGVTVKLWDTIAGKELLTLKGGRGANRSMALSPDNKLLAAGNSENEGATIWDMVARKAMLRFHKHAHGAWSVAFSPDGKLLASGGGDGTVKIWDVRDWTGAAKHSSVGKRK